MRVAGRVEADSWSLIVSDTGPGIPAEALDRVFEPFFRLARDEHSGIEGSGLGLAICRELVTQLQGQIALGFGGRSRAPRSPSGFPLATKATAHSRPDQPPGRSQPAMASGVSGIDSVESSRAVAPRAEPPRSGCR